MSRYMVVIERSQRGYSAYVPDLPGCIATGRTRAVVDRRITTAIKMHLEGLREDGQEAPEPTAAAAYVSARPLRRRAG